MRRWLIEPSVSSAISRWNPRQNRRTHSAGGSKYIIGIVSHIWIGSAPPSWVR
jgi:hypothetical protein